MDFLEKVDYLMGRFGLTRTTLSQKSNIPYTTIDGWYKKGYEGLKLTTLRKLADYFNTTLDYWILDDIKDPNYGKSMGFPVEYHEMEHIKKYRALDTHGKKMVDFVLDEEHERCEALNQPQQEEVATIEEIPDRSYLIPVAAHERTDIEVTDEMRQHDDDIMDDF